MNRKLKILLISAGVVITPVLLSPLPRFNPPHSTVVVSSDETLLGARIAGDGQWRFPEPDSVPVKFEKAVLTFEDRFFRYHPGVNPVAIVRAMILNIRSGTIVSGGSTITMQVARLARGNSKRTYPGKMLEMLSALKLELFRSKDRILQLWCANAPFGGNTVGLEAAAWRYLGKPSSGLTWAEAASLAVLPNSPGMVFPGRNQERLRQRRDELLKKMYGRGFFDSLSYVLALEEPLLEEPGPMPVLAPHLTDCFFISSGGHYVKTTIDATLQERANEIINSRQKDLSANLINNLACLIVNVRTGNVLAYVGNSISSDPSANEGDVDMIRARRSSGSILKPFLYAAMLTSGELLPDALVPDIPTRFQGFSPENFNKSFSGAVPASKALAQSLNIPAVRMLRDYTPERFLSILGKTGFTTFNETADHYGLSLILGGGETTLWELTGAYASLSRILNNFNQEKKYFTGDIHEPVLIAATDNTAAGTVTTDPVYPASSLWLTYEALRKVNRPDEESGWQFFSSPRDLAWKTGTSYGFRDAWAVGTTPEYVIGVWAGNADGEGRPGLTGISAAAPVLFDLVNLMGTGGWFGTPLEDLTSVTVCKQSGYRAGPDCPETIEILAPVNGLRFDACPFHKTIHIDKSGTKQVSAACYPASEIRNVPWFILPPAMEYYFKLKNPDYRMLPPVMSGCPGEKSIQEMEFIYPSDGAKIFIPRDQSGTLTRIIPEIIHRKPSKKIFWHLDEKYLLTTTHYHQLELLAGPGDHILTAVDEDGNTIRCRFRITSGIRKE